MNRPVVDLHLSMKKEGARIYLVIDCLKIGYWTEEDFIRFRDFGEKFWAGDFTEIWLPHLRPCDDAIEGEVNDAIEEKIWETVKLEEPSSMAKIVVAVAAFVLEDRSRAIEDEREACAKILDGEAEYYRSIVEGAVVMMESRAYHRTAAKVAAHLARKIRARSDVKP